MHLLLARAEHAAEHSARTRRGELLLPCRVEHRSAQGASACVIFTRNESRNHAHRFPGRTRFLGGVARFIARKKSKEPIDAHWLRFAKLVNRVTKSKSKSRKAWLKAHR